MCDVLLSHLSLLQPDNILLYFRKKTNIQKKPNNIYIAERPNQRLPRFPPLDIHPWMGCSVISHGLIQSAIPKSLATGHCTGEDRLSFIVTSISNWRLVIFMNLLVAQTSLFVRVRVRERACVHYVCNRATKWPIDSDIQSIISGPSLINGNSALQ